MPGITHTEVAFVCGICDVRKKYRNEKMADKYRKLHYIVAHKVD
jgi:hypothetical protein